MMRRDSIPVQAGTYDCGLFAEGTSLGSVARKWFEERKIPHPFDRDQWSHQIWTKNGVLFQLNVSQF